MENNVIKYDLVYAMPLTYLQQGVCKRKREPCLSSLFLYSGCTILSEFDPMT